jgi:integrase
MTSLRTTRALRRSRGEPQPERVGVAAVHVDNECGDRNDRGDLDVGRWLDGSALRRRYRDAQTVASLRPLRFHDLRHTFGTHGRTSAESDRELQEWMATPTPGTTARYTHYRPRKDAARRLSQSFEPEQPETESKPETEKIERGTS